MSSRFNIRDTVPGSSVDPPVQQETYNQIDFMAFLLDTLTYKKLYTMPLESLFEFMIRRIYLMPTDLATPAERTEATATLTAMRTWANGKGLTIRTLFQTYYPRGSEEEQNIIKPFRDLTTLSKSRLCLPFLRVQGLPGNTVDDDIMECHIRKLGERTFVDLFRFPKHLYPEVADGIRHGRANGLLSEDPSKERKECDIPEGDGADDCGSGQHGALSGGGGNYRKCGPQGCQDNTDPTFCNVASDGTCSTVSS